MSASTPVATVIVCTRDRADSLSLVLDDLAAQVVPAGTRWEVLVVDNGSSDATGKVLEARGREGDFTLRSVFEPRPGKSLALNRGIEAAAGNILLFTDDDVRIPPGWVAAMLAPFDDPRCMGVAGAVRPTWLGPRPRWVSDAEPYRMMAAIVQYWQGPEPHDAEIPPIGANAAWRREVFSRHGGFRTDLGPAGGASPLGEDTELGLRMLRHGEPVRYEPAALIWHPVQPARLNRRYFLRWYYESGKWEPYRPGAPTGVRVLGVPRYLFRELLESLVRWMAALEPRRRFYFKLRVWQTAGRIRGFLAARHPSERQA